MLLALLLALSLALSSSSVIVQASSSMFMATSLVFAPRFTQVHREASESVSGKALTILKASREPSMNDCLSFCLYRKTMNGCLVK